MPDLGSVNKVILVGYLGKDPELKTTLEEPRTAFTVLDVATKEYFGRASGKQPEVTWHKCIVWGKAAEIACEYGRKGSLIAIDGKIKKKAWQTEDGQRRKSVEIQVNNLTFLGGKIKTDEFSAENDDLGEEKEGKKIAPY